MALEVFVHGFRDGDEHDTDVAVVEAALAPYLVRHGEFADLRFADGEAELYGAADLAGGFMVKHLSGEAGWDALVDIAKACDFVIMPAMENGVVIVDEAQRAHLPPDLAEHGVTLVASGKDLLRHITSG